MSLVKLTAKAPLREGFVGASDDVVGKEAIPCSMRSIKVYLSLLSLFSLIFKKLPNLTLESGGCIRRSCDRF